MVDEIYEYMPNLLGNHTLCYFMNDCRITLKQKNPSEGNDVRSPKSEHSKSISNHNASCCPVTDVFFVWKDSNTWKQHVENISQMYGKNSWGFCQRSNQKKTRSAHPFEGARYWLGCSRSTLSCHLSESLNWLERMTDTKKPSKTLKPLQSKLPARAYKKYKKSVHRSVCYGKNRLEIKRLQR